MAINLTETNNGSVSVKKKAKKKSTLSEIGGITLFEKPPSLKDRMYFTERLALMLETGSALHGSLRILKRSMSNSAMVEVITSIEDTIDKGGSFASALSQNKALFDATYVNLVAAGEQAGFLPDVLKQLYTMDKKRLEMHSKVIAAMSYPAFLLFFSVSVVLFVVLVLFPKFATLFESLGDRLPMSTRILMSMSNTMSEHWFLLAIALGCFVVTVVYVWQRQGVIEWRDRMKLSIPYLRETVMQLYLLQTLRVLSLSIKNGVNVLDAIKGCRDVVQNKVFQDFLDETALLVETGAGISAGFAKNPLIPDLVKQMVETGEETGNLAKVMQRIADHYEEEMSKRILNISKLAEPIMLVVMGGFVGMLVSSLIMPIFQLSRAVH